MTVSNLPPLQYVEQIVIPRLKAHLEKEGRPEPPFFQLQHPDGEVWAEMAVRQEWFNDRTRMYQMVQDMTSQLPIPAVVYYSYAVTLIPKESRMDDYIRASRDGNMGVDEMVRKGLGKAQDVLW